jgi:hypothetical protein
MRNWIAFMMLGLIILGAPAASAAQEAPLSSQQRVDMLFQRLNTDQKNEMGRLHKIYYVRLKGINKVNEGKMAEFQALWGRSDTPEEKLIELSRDISRLEAEKLLLNMFYRVKLRSLIGPEAADWLYAESGVNNAQ